jgi:hypothetical protein
VYPDDLAGSFQFEALPVVLKRESLDDGFGEAEVAGTLRIFPSEARVVFFDLPEAAGLRSRGPFRALGAGQVHEFARDAWEMTPEGRVAHAELAGQGDHCRPAPILPRGRR